jgi:hypothetical protein
MVDVVKPSTWLIDSSRSEVLAPLFVIASEAKQSRVVGGTLDCFVASLLAMTGGLKL